MKRILFLGLIILMSLKSICQIPDPMPNTYVNDFAQVMNADEVQSLNERIRTIEDSSSVQIAIVIIDQLPDKVSVDDYALSIGRIWKVGMAKNGIVFVAAINDKQMRLEVADQLQGDITDMTSGHILKGIQPYFRTKDYSGGIHHMLDDINDLVNPVRKQQLELARQEELKRHEEFVSALFNVLLSILMIGVCCFLTWWVYFRPKMLQRKKEEKEKEDMYAKRREEIYATGRIQKKFVRTESDSKKSEEKKEESKPYIPMPIITPSSDDSSSSSRSSSDDSNFGNWGGSSGGDSGFSGGGASDSW